MADSIGGFVKVSSRDGATLYLNPHHVTAVEIGPECSIRLHDGSKIAVTEDPEELVRSLDAYLPRASSRGVRLRQRRRRRGM